MLGIWEEVPIGHELDVRKLIKSSETKFFTREKVQTNQM